MTAKMRHIALGLLLARTAVAGPTVTIAFPDPEIAKIDGPIPLSAEAVTSTGRVSSVRFYLDGVLLSEQPGPATRPQQTLWKFFAQRWDSRTVANGTHTLVVQAIDSTGSSSAQMRSFVVDNTPWQCVPAGTSGGDSAAIINALAATNRAVLCPNTTYYLLASIKLKRASSIYTLGYPTDGTRAKLVYNASSTAAAINGDGQSFAFLRSIQIIGPDGGTPARGEDDNGNKIDALVSIGGWATDMFVDSVRIVDPHGWSLFHIFEGPLLPSGRHSCAHAVITRNDLGPSSFSSSVADGISLACGDSVVTDNTIIDATDGAIVAFGASGSLVARNVITSFTRILHGGINMVDIVGWGGDFTGTRVESNTIDAKWGIRSAIAVGANTWGCDEFSVSDLPNAVHGGAVVNNAMTGLNMGYGIPVNDARDWVVTGNTSTASHGGTPVGCSYPSATPAPFQALASNVASVSLQSGYVDARVEFLPGLTLTRATYDRVLSDGTPVTLSASAGTDTYYDFYIPPGTTRYTISIAGSSGDADLYVRRDVPPTTDLWTCRPYTGSSNESCGDNFPVEGHYYVMVRAFSTYSSVTLTATRSTALWSGISLPDVRGLKTNVRYTSIAIPSGTHTLTVNTSGGPGDMDLYVSKTNNRPDLYPDCVSYTSTATESCTLTVTGPNTAYIGMKAYTDYVHTQLTATVSP